MPVDWFFVATYHKSMHRDDLSSPAMSSFKYHIFIFCSNNKLFNENADTIHEQ